MRVFAPIACVVTTCLLLGLPARPATLGAPDQRRALPGPVDVLYAAPGDLNYSYGPSGAQLNRLTTGKVVTATFVVTYDANFNANQPAKDAFQAAVNIWANTIVSSSTIRVRANFAPLGANVLGSAGPTAICNTSGDLNSWYAAALADKLEGSQFCASLNGGETHEIEANFSSNQLSWDFGTSGTGVNGKYNFMTVVLHELGHGLGFYGSMDSDGVQGSFGRGPRPDIYDRFAVTGGGSPLLGFVNPSVALHNQLVSNNTFFNGTNARANNGGASPKLETHAFGVPSANGWLEGSSYSHVDDDLYTGTPNGLMTWALNSNEVYTDPGPVTRGMFQDEGWTLGSTTVCTYSLAPSSANVPHVATVHHSVTVTTQTGCPWTAVSNSTFVTITSAASGSGTGVFIFSVAANTGTNQRIGTLTVAGLTFTITQLPPAVAGDFNGDGRTDRAVFRPASGIWFIEGQADIQLGLPGDIPVPADYVGDGATDAAVYRPSTGEWFIQGQAPIQWGAPGDVPVPADYDGNGKADQAVYRTTDGFFATWYINGQPPINWGVRGDIPVPGDYDGDGRADIVVFRPSTAVWYIAYSSSNFVSTAALQFGLPGDTPVPGDFDGDNHNDLAVFRGSTGQWFLTFSGSNFTAVASFVWGAAGDLPIVLDIDGDRLDDLGVFRPSNGMWLTYNWVNGTTTNRQFGLPGDVPVIQRPRLPMVTTSDFDGDGRSDVTVFRPSSGVWHVRYSAANFTTSTAQQFGLNGDVIVPGDYDGDRLADVAVYRPSNGVWYFRHSSTGAVGTVQWGLPADTPVPADYDGDGKTDAAVYRPSTGEWFVLQSSTGFSTFTTTQWGLSSDQPVPGDFDGDGRADLAVFRPSTGVWYFRLSTVTFGATIVKQFGLSTDLPQAVDFDGDGRADLGLFRPATGEWLAVDALTTLNPINKQWGLSGDIPVSNDYDGDGMFDAAVFRPGGEWFLKLSSTPAGNGSFTYLQWGLSADTPVVSSLVDPGSGR